MVCLPNVNALILRSSHNVLSIVTERRFYLGRNIRIALVLAAQIQITQIIQPNSTVVRRHENLVLARHRFYAANLSACFIATTCRSDVNLCVILELIGIVKYAPSIVGADNCKFAILTEVCSGYELGLTVHFIPKRHFFVGYIPQSKFAIETATEKVAIVARMESNGGDKVYVLEAAQTFASRYMP